MGTFYLTYQDHFRSLGAPLCELGSNSKMAHCRVEQTKFGFHRGVCSMYMGNCNLENVQFIWGSFNSLFSQLGRLIVE